MERASNRPPVELAGTRSVASTGAMPATPRPSREARQRAQVLIHQQLTGGQSRRRRVSQPGEAGSSNHGMLTYYLSRRALIKTTVTLAGSPTPPPTGQNPHPFRNETPESIAGRGSRGQRGRQRSRQPAAERQDRRQAGESNRD